MLFLSKSCFFVNWRFKLLARIHQTHFPWLTIPQIAHRFPVRQRYPHFFISGCICRFMYATMVKLYDYASDPTYTSKGITIEIFSQYYLSNITFSSIYLEKYFHKWKSVMYSTNHSSFNFKKLWCHHLGIRQLPRQSPDNPSRRWSTAACNFRQR
jgi:hypothetical protein